VKAKKLRNNNKTNKERGASVFLGLFAILIISGYILVNVRVDEDRIRNERVTQTAWLIKQVSEAARLYVRDQNALGTAAFQKTTLCTTPRVLTVNDLVSNGYIGATVGERNSAGTNFVTPLDQTIQIIAANSVIDSASCTTPQLRDIAATAYLVFQPPAQGIDNITLAALAEALALEDMPVGNPIFDGAGVNISDNCGGTPATIQWDTGCLDNAQFTFLTGGTAFTNAYMGIPAWLTFRGDSRAVFRYEQAENPAATQMQTDLMMASMDNNNDIAVCTQRQYTASEDAALLAANPTLTKQVSSGVCDDIGSQQNVNNVGTIETTRAINSGFTTSGSTNVTGNVRGYNATNTIQMNGVDFTGASNITVNRQVPAATYAPRIFMDNLTANIVQANDGSAINSDSLAGETSVINTFSVNGGNMTVSDPTDSGRGVLANTIAGSANNISVTNNATFGGIATIAGQTSLSGNATIPLAAGRIDVGSVTANGDVNVGSSLSVSGTTNTDISFVDTCLGDCPARSPDPGPPLP